MGLLNILFGGGTSKEACEVKVNLSKDEIKSWSMRYYKGDTSYRSYFNGVISQNMDKLHQITEPAKDKAAQGCNIDDVYVNFYFNNSNYILIPFDLFSEKENMTISRRNNKVWNKDNIVRILNNYPKFRNFDERVERRKNEEDGIYPEPIPEPEPTPVPPKPVPKPITPPTPKPKPTHKKIQSITLESNGKSRLIVKTQTITRDIVKSSFGNHNEIYNKQFEIMKDNNSDWFIKGYDVPSESKDSKGNIYHFHRTIYNGIDVTNRYTKIESNGIIKVGSVEFLVKF